MGKDVNSQWLGVLFSSGNGTSEKAGRDTVLDWDPHSSFSLYICLLAGDNFEFWLKNLNLWRPKWLLVVALNLLPILLGLWFTLSWGRGPGLLSPTWQLSRTPIPAWVSLCFWSLHSKTLCFHFSLSGPNMTVHRRLCGFLPVLYRMETSVGLL